MLAGHPANALTDFPRGTSHTHNAQRRVHFMVWKQSPPACTRRFSFFPFRFSFPPSLLVADALDAGRDGGEDFVGDGSEAVGDLGDGQAGAEDDDRIAFARVGVGHVDHAEIHADVAHGGAAVMADEHLPDAVAKAAVHAVGVTDGDDGDARGAGDVGAAAVTDGVASGDVLDLQDGGAERADGLQAAAVAVGGADAVEGDAEAHHVHLLLAEALYTG